MPRSSRPALVVARYAVIEALRSGLPWLAGACLLAALGLAGFLSRVAITEGAALQAATSAALLRACAVFLIAAHVVASVAREANDKGLELALALPISRPAYYLGKLLGFACCAALLATLFALPLLFWARPADLAAWWISLAAEAAMVAAAALFFASALSQTVAAIAAAAGLYLLARAMPAIQAIAGGPLADDTLAGGAARWVVDALALLLPRLDAVARSDWLLYGAPAADELALALAGLALYGVLLAAAGLFDFARRNL
ncbi:MAG: ABC transporter permease subunit [Betaproteobacteria bacterium]|nr:ABC transporter permease subunit [Betaproteobacteria bacterium]